MSSSSSSSSAASPSAYSAGSALSTAPELRQPAASVDCGSSNITIACVPAMHLSDAQLGNSSIVEVINRCHNWKDLLPTRAPAQARVANVMMLEYQPDSTPMFKVVGIGAEIISIFQATSKKDMNLAIERHYGGEDGEFLKSVAADRRLFLAEDTKRPLYDVIDAFAAKTTWAVTDAVAKRLMEVTVKLRGLRSGLDWEGRAFPAVEVWAAFIRYSFSTSLDVIGSAEQDASMRQNLRDLGATTLLNVCVPAEPYTWYSGLLTAFIERVVDRAALKRDFGFVSENQLIITCESDNAARFELLLRPGDSQNKAFNVLVCDAGGGTTDLSASRSSGNGLEFTPLFGDRGIRCGGRDVDDAMIEGVLQPLLKGLAKAAPAPGSSSAGNLKEYVLLTEADTLYRPGLSPAQVRAALEEARKHPFSLQQFQAHPGFGSFMAEWQLTKQAVFLEDRAGSRRCVGTVPLAPLASFLSAVCNGQLLPADAAKRARDAAKYADSDKGGHKRIEPMGTSGVDDVAQLSADLLYGTWAGPVQKTVALVKEVLKHLKAQGVTMDKLLLVGGLSKSDYFARMVGDAAKAVFPAISLREPSSHASDKAAVLGGILACWTQPPKVRSPYSAVAQMDWTFDEPRGSASLGSSLIAELKECRCMDEGLLWALRERARQEDAQEQHGFSLGIPIVAEGSMVHPRHGVSSEFKITRSPANAPTFVSMLLFKGDAMRPVRPDTIDPTTGGLRIHERFIIGKPPVAPKIPASSKRASSASAAAAAADVSRWYLAADGAGVRRYSCAVAGLGSDWTWCSPHLVVLPPVPGAPRNEPRFRLHLVANTGATADCDLTWSEGDAARAAPSSSSSSSSSSAVTAVAPASARPAASRPPSSSAAAPLRYSNDDDDDDDDDDDGGDVSRGRSASYPKRQRRQSQPYLPSQQAAAPASSSSTAPSSQRRPQGRGASQASPSAAAASPVAPSSSASSSALLSRLRAAEAAESEANSLWVSL